jgi:hypothetical protein
MATITSIHEDGSTIKPIPVRNSANVIVERVDASGARRLCLASNATPIYSRKRGEIVGIQLADIGNDSLKKKLHGDPRKYTYLDCSELMPQGVHTLRYLPKSTADLYVTVRADCMRKAA